MIGVLFLAATMSIARSLQELASVDIDSKCYFDLTGRVLAVDGASFVLEDGENRLSFACSSDVSFESGDLLHLQGYSYTGKLRYRYNAPTNVVRIGKTKATNPEKVSVSDIARGACDLKLVTVEGLVTDVHLDELSENGCFLTISDGEESGFVYLCGKRKLSNLLGARVSVTGICMSKSNGWRVFTSRFVTALSSPSVLEPPPEDRFSVPALNNHLHITPQALSGLGFRKTTGIVRAVWRKNRILVESGNWHGLRVVAVLAEGVTPPPVGAAVCVSGMPETDFISITLDNAVWKSDPSYSAVSEHNVKDVNFSDLFGAPNNQRGLNASLHGCLVRLTGQVGNVKKYAASAMRFPLEVGDRTVAVDMSGVGKDGASIIPPSGSTVTVTGVVIVEGDRWRPPMEFPTVNGLVVVLRSPEDLHVDSRPPWWTLRKMSFVVCLMLTALILIILWNRILNHLVERRSRELSRERSAHEGAQLKLEERTRLAVELHDSLSQNLEGVACFISAMKNILDVSPGLIGGHLAIVEKMLGSCRTELRRCLFDLRGDALESKSFAEALHRTLDPLAFPVAIDISFPVRTSAFDDAGVHAVLCIVRELVANAVRHAAARKIRIEGAILDGVLSFSVFDDGKGFDPQNCDGPEQGHFGLQGVRDRIRRLNGTFAISSRPGGPTVVKVTIPITQ